MTNNKMILYTRNPNEFKGVYEIVYIDKETKKDYIYKGQKYSKKTGTCRQPGSGIGQHDWNYSKRLIRIIGENDKYIRSADACNFLIVKETMETIACPTFDTQERNKWMDSLGEYKTTK